MCQALEHQNTGALAHDKAAALFVKRTARLLRILLQRERMHIRKTGNCHRRDARLGAACDRRIQITVADGAHRLADCLRTGCTGTDRRIALTLEAERHRDMRRRHIRNHHRNGKRGDTARSLVQQFLMLGLKHLQAADARADERADAERIDAALHQAGLLHRFLCRRQRKLAVAVHMRRFLLIQKSQRIKIGDFTGDRRFVSGGVKRCDRLDAVSAVFQSVPVCRYGIAQRRHRTHSGKYNSFHPVPPHSAMPPSATMTCPVMYDARSDARNAAISAISSAFPKRPREMRALAPS